MLKANELAEQYGAKSLPDRILKKIDLIKSAQTLDEAVFLSKKSMDSAHTHILASWAKGEIPGIITSHTIDKRIKRAESLIKMLDDKGLDDQANQQRNKMNQLKKDFGLD